MLYNAKKGICQEEKWEYLFVNCDKIFYVMVLICINFASLIPDCRNL